MPDGVTFPIPDPVEGQPTPEDDSMPAPEIAETGNLSIAHTLMANSLAGASAILNGGYAASADRRTSRADQLSGDTQAMWASHLTTPTVMAAHGMRVASEAGSGRTRAETNLPASTSAAGNATTGGAG